jgi:RNA polymerase sigma-70 factor, ECF subfamily
MDMKTTAEAERLARDQVILERLQAGDMSACAACIELHSDALYRLAWRLLGNEAEAEEVVQETFLNAFKSLDSFDGRSTLGTWLFRITYNTALMRLRRPNPYTLPVEEATSSAAIVPEQLFDVCCLPERDLLSSEAQAHIEAAVSELPAALRLVFQLRELEGMSTADVADVLSLSESAVKVRLHRARLALRETLSDYFVERLPAGPEERKRHDP